MTQPNPFQISNNQILGKETKEEIISNDKEIIKLSRTEPTSFIIDVSIPPPPLKYLHPGLFINICKFMSPPCHFSHSSRFIELYE